MTETKTGKDIEIQVVQYTSEKYGEMTVLCIGDIVKKSDLAKQYKENISRLESRKEQLRPEIAELVKQEIKVKNPEVYNAKYERSEHHEKFYSLQHEILETLWKTHPTGQETVELSDRIYSCEKEMRANSYNFDGGDENMPVGTKAMLTYWVKDPSEIKENVAEAVQWGHMTDEERKKYEQIQTALESQEFIAYIPQLEVLGPQRKQGLARKLLQRAIKLISDQGIQQTFAKVLVKDHGRLNNHQFTTIELLKEKEFIPCTIDEMSGEYTLVARYNPPNND